MAEPPFHTERLVLRKWRGDNTAMVWSIDRSAWQAVRG
jgi:hypothetical protein